MEPKQVTRIIIVDDHPMTVDGYVTLLSAVDEFEKLFYLGYNCKDAFELIQEFENTSTVPDIAFLDLNLPPYEEQHLYSGTDIAAMLRQVFPRCKLVVISMHKEPVWVNQIFKSIGPEGFISKNDINYESFPQVYQALINGETFVSQSIVEAQKMFLQKNIQWDAYDSKILQLLAEGVRTRNIPNYIALSLSAIEKRKANIRRQILFEEGSDKELIDAARHLGLI
ncbi:MAG TPA: response regulator [Flavobacterium sp.]